MSEDGRQASMHASSASMYVRMQLYRYTDIQQGDSLVQIIFRAQSHRQWSYQNSTHDGYITSSLPACIDHAGSAGIAHRHSNKPAALPCLK